VVAVVIRIVAPGPAPPKPAGVVPEASRELGA
jgi:hypothetical protein